MENKCDIVKNYILDKIHRKIYCPGQMIDSEADLARKLDISRMTVRKALDILAQEGIVFKEKGRGTFVARQPKYAEFQYGVGFTQEARKRGMVPSTRNASLKLCSADKDIARKLHLKEGDKVWRVTRVRCADDIPVAYVYEYYNYLHCEDMTEETIQNSIYDYLEKKGISFAFLDQKLEAVACPAHIAEALGTTAGTPVILMTLTVYMKNGIPFNFGYEYYRTDKFTLVQSVYNRELGS